MWKGARTGKKRGKKRVGTGAETGFKRQKNGISPNSTIWNGVERPFFAVPHLSTVFFAVPALFSPVLDDFRQKREKKGRQKMEERERKETRSFQFLSRSRFFPFLSAHISSQYHLQDMEGKGRIPCLSHVLVCNEFSVEMFLEKKGEKPERERNWKGTRSFLSRSSIF